MSQQQLTGFVIKPRTHPGRHHMPRTDSTHDPNSDVSNSPAFDEEVDAENSAQLVRVEPIEHVQTKETVASVPRDNKISDPSAQNHVKAVPSSAGMRTEECATTDPSSASSAGFRSLIEEDQPLPTSQTSTKPAPKPARSKNDAENKPPKKARRKTQTARGTKKGGIPAGQMHHWILSQPDDDLSPSVSPSNDEPPDSASSPESTSHPAQISFFPGGMDVSPLLVSPSRSLDPAPLPALTLDVDIFPSIAALGQYPTLYVAETVQQGLDRVNFQHYTEQDFYKLATDDPETFIRVTIPYLSLKKSANDFMLFKAWFTKYEACHPWMKNMVVDTEKHPSKRASHAWDRLDQACRDEWTVVSRRVTAMHPVRYPMAAALLGSKMQKKIEAVYQEVYGVAPPKPEHYRDMAKAVDESDSGRSNLKRGLTPDENVDTWGNGPRKRKQ